MLDKIISWFNDSRGKIFISAILIICGFTQPWINLAGKDLSGIDMITKMKKTYLLLILVLAIVTIMLYFFKSPVLRALYRVLPFFGGLLGMLLLGLIGYSYIDYFEFLHGFWLTFIGLLGFVSSAFRIYSK